MKVFMDLPAEVICIIASFSDVKTVNILRLVCLTNQDLYNKVYPDLTSDVKKRAILMITGEKCGQLDVNKHYNCIIQSEPCISALVMRIAVKAAAEANSTPRKLLLICSD